jgi:hypothetical protein
VIDVDGCEVPSLLGRPDHLVEGSRPYPRRAPAC